MTIRIAGGPATALPVAPWIADAAEYWVDQWQRSVLFWDVLRQRGNGYLEHLEAGQPPALVFEYEEVMDARTFERPANYALLRILDRRDTADDRRQQPRDDQEPHRSAECLHARSQPHPRQRPLVIIDPRAGHGPGIGGSKFNSQIGVALDFNFPVYFVMFFPEPEPGQTLADVHRAEICFLEEVARRHPDAPRPAVIGNCQAGWATALIGADRPDVTGPMVLNGSPLSYWGGVEGANPMRYRGGLCGGTWLTTLWCDLGNGTFDGANLVAGFEDLNPANTHWTKLYHLYTKVDTEAERFLTFEKWWGGFYKMNAAEIHFIVENLFIGNSLEQGVLELAPGEPINLKNIKDPILVFASNGDNITPPPQALNWIKKVYGSVAEIRRHGQVIVYMVHEDVGHLGIFVSGSVAKKEHKEIIGCLEMLDYLSPGLYEMVIEGDPSQPWLDDYQVGFEERDMGDLLKNDDGFEDEEAFARVAQVSRFNDQAYHTLVRPWVRLAVNGATAETLRLLHPLRVQRYALSDRNPLLAPVKWAAPWVRSQRRPVRPDNPYLALEAVFSESVQAGWNLWRDARDRSQELLFQCVYGNPWLKQFLGTADTVEEGAPQLPPARKPSRWEFSVGGFAEALVRTLLAVAVADRSLDKRQFEKAQEIVRSSPRLRGLTPAAFQRLIREQARLLEADWPWALAGLADLLPSREERREVYAAAREIAPPNLGLTAEEEQVLGILRDVVGMADN
ncbi:MAG: DUF3141 domain-containing protein [Deferrisomatales bacterium]|nr:DUF3141 domain-containing protein [Deferrisomatales bacterium]